jgi:hypothetical protein
MNSSIAASMMASRRSAARAARLGSALSGEASGKGGFGALAETVFCRDRGLAGFDGVFRSDPGREFAIATI